MQKEYIKTGEFDKKYSLYLSQAFQIRNNTDYSDFFVASQSDAKVVAFEFDRLWNRGKRKTGYLWELQKDTGMLKIWDEFH